VKWALIDGFTFRERIKVLGECRMDLGSQAACHRRLQQGLAVRCGGTCREGASVAFARGLQPRSEPPRISTNHGRDVFTKPSTSLIPQQLSLCAAWKPLWRIDICVTNSGGLV